MMGNPISPEIRLGAVGELLVLIRLLQYGVQAAPPLKDSGNDLIAVRGEAFRGVQVKTRTKGRFSCNGLPDHYHLLALVWLVGDGDQIYLDSSEVYLIPRAEIADLPKLKGDYSAYRICQELIDKLFQA